MFLPFFGEINKTNVQILDLPPEDVRKINGEEYEPSTLTGLQGGIQRFLSDSVMLLKATTKINIHRKYH